MKPVIMDAAAEDELLESVIYYNELREGLGNELQELVEESIRKIAQTPKAFSPHGKAGFRKFVLPRFPFNIFYLDQEDHVWIAAVANQRRKPDYWSHREPPEAEDS